MTSKPADRIQSDAFELHLIKSYTADKKREILSLNGIMKATECSTEKCEGDLKLLETINKLGDSISKVPADCMN